MPTGFQLNTVNQLGLSAQTVHDSGKLTGVAASLTEIFFKAIDFLDHRHRDDQVVVFKAEKSFRIIMQQDICVKNKGFSHYRDSTF